MVAIIQILDDFREVAAQEVLVREQLLICEQLADLVLPGLVALAHNRHCIVVLLPVEDHIEASLVEFAHRNAIRAFCEDLNLVDSSVFFFILVSPLALADLRRRDEAQDLRSTCKEEKLRSA